MAKTASEKTKVHKEFAKGRNTERETQGKNFMLFDITGWLCCVIIILATWLVVKFTLK